MSYQTYTAVTGGVTVGVWAPWGTPVGTVLLLGRTPAGWTSVVPSRLPRELTSRGLWCVTVDVPNWGNQTDLDRIDAALGFATNQGRDVDRLRVVAHSRGAVAAVNWSVRHPDRLAALSLVSPVIDLEERWNRVTADRPSLEAAYGGSTASFNTAMPTWNPVAGDTRAWGRRVLDRLGSRMNRFTMWWADTDTDTPAAVHTALAAYYRCSTGVLANPDPAFAIAGDIAQQLDKQAAGWQRSASIMQHRWDKRRRDNTGTADWAGGDGARRIDLPDGRRVWSHQDTRTGTINPDESRSGGTIVSNSGIVENTDGTLGASLHFTGSTGVWLRPDDHASGHWYWVNDAIVEGPNLRWIATHYEPAGSIFPFKAIGTHIVTVDATTLAQTAISVRPFNGDHNWGYSLWAGPQHTYITGTAPTVFLSGRTALARAPAGNVLAAWEYWTGDDWSPNENDAVPLRGVDGKAVPISGGGLHKIPGGPWLLAANETPAFGDKIRIYKSLWGPYRPDQWEHHFDFRMEPHTSMIVQGDRPFLYGGSQIYLPDSAPGELLMSHEVNHGAAATIDSGLYQPQFFTIPRP